MSSIKRGFLFLVLFAHWNIQGQENLTGFWQPQVGLGYQVSEQYAHNFSVASRFFIVEEGETTFSNRQIDLVHFSNYKIRENQSLALGIQYRFRESFDGGANELRLTQQYNQRSRPFVIRFGHRIRSEQRITKARTTHRFRYRFALDFALQGEKLDVGEAYLVATVEPLLSIAKGRNPEYDGRISAQIGWQLQKDFKIQFGTEYRMEDFTHTLPEHVFFILSSVQLTL